MTTRDEDLLLFLGLMDLFHPVESIQESRGSKKAGLRLVKAAHLRLRDKSKTLRKTQIEK